MSVRGKLFFLTGAAVGYVFGARAGRKRYDQIVAAVNRIRETPAFQRQVQQAQDYAARKIGELPSVLVRSVTRSRVEQGTSGE
jgi:oxygen-dependent protoporphyrinogen oxidase